MDATSRQVIQFLEALSAFVWGEDLYRGQDSLWMRLVRRGLSPTRPGSSLTVTAGPRTGLVIGTSVKVTSEKELDFTISLLPDGEGWTIETDVFFDLWPEGDGQRSMRDFPARRARTMGECLAQLRAAATDLAECDKVLDEIVALGLLHSSDRP